MRPALARVPGVGHVEVLASDTREIEVIARSRASCSPPNLTVDDVVGGAQGAEPARSRSAASRQRPAASRARVRALWTSVDDIARHAGRREGRRDAARVATSATVAPGAPDRTSLVAGQGGDAARDQHLAADRRQHPRPCGRASKTRSTQLQDGAAGRPAARPRPTTSPSSSQTRSPTCATPS